MTIKPNTDSGRFLEALLAAYPAPVWNPNRKLGLTAHSRACDLRRAGYDVIAVSKPAPHKGAKRIYGYYLKSRTPKAAAA